MMGWQHPKISITMTCCELCTPHNIVDTGRPTAGASSAACKYHYAVAASGDLLRARNKITSTPKVMTFGPSKILSYITIRHQLHHQPPPHRQCAVTVGCVWEAQLELQFSA
eukprot:scaffold2679_cov85-Cyclotella_meneghiniana.AAC.4